MGFFTWCELQRVRIVQTIEDDHQRFNRIRLREVETRRSWYWRDPDVRKLYLAGRL